MDQNIFICHLINFARHKSRNFFFAYVNLIRIKSFDTNYVIYNLIDLL